MKVVLNRRLALVALLTGVAWATAGCGGFNGTYSASPAMLLLQNRPARSSVIPASPEVTLSGTGASGPATAVVSVD